MNRAVAAARKAFDEGPWPKMTAYVSFPVHSIKYFSHHFHSCILFFFHKCHQERSKILLRFADLVEKHADEISALEVWDNGKPYEQAAGGEILLFIRFFWYYAGKQY